MNLHQFELFLFDLDDTLINTRESYHRAQEKALTTLCQLIPGFSKDLFLQSLRSYAQQTGSGQYELYFQLFLNEHTDLSPKEGKEVFETMVKTYEEHYWSNLTEFSDSRNFLNTLHHKHIPMALVSNGETERQLKKLQHTSLQQFFSPKNSFISGAFATEQKKPSPFMVQSACRNYQILERKTLFFGNTVEDMIAGNSAGTSTAFITESCPLPPNLSANEQPDKVFSSWAAVIREFETNSL